MDKILYNRYSDFLKKKYGEKVYKLPINLPLTCPNRDGQVGFGGCIYCGETGAGFEILCRDSSVSVQIEEDAKKIKKLYNVKKFIAYFQNFSNTYMPLEQFKFYMEEAAKAKIETDFDKFDSIVEISVATRPDCINDDYLKTLKDICCNYNISAVIELGLQTVNYRTLEKINRGHTLAEFIDAVLRIKKFGFDVCTHVILNLPWDNMTDSIETSKIISSLGINQVKLHALYILKDTVLADMYENNEFEIITAEEYMERVITFLEYLSPDIVIQRIIGRSPKDSSIFANWGMSWWKIHDEIQDIMIRENRYQGKKFNYLNGLAVSKFSNR